MEIIDCRLLFSLKFDHIFEHRERKMHSCTHQQMDWYDYRLIFFFFIFLRQVTLRLHAQEASITFSSLLCDQDLISFHCKKQESHQLFSQIWAIFVCGSKLDTELFF